MVMHVILTNLCAFLWFGGQTITLRAVFTQKKRKNTQIHMRLDKDLQSTQK